MEILKLIALGVGAFVAGVIITLVVLRILFTRSLARALGW